jgi:hypothetical protein
MTSYYGYFILAVALLAGLSAFYQGPTSPVPHLVCAFSTLLWLVIFFGLRRA